MSEMFDHIKQFKLLAEIPVIKSAEFVEDQGNHFTIRTNLTSRSYGTLSRFTHRAQINLEESSELTDLPKTRWINTGSAIETSDDPIKAIFSANSLNKSPYTVILRETKNGQKGSCRTVELWQGQRLLKRVDVTEAHGSFFTDDLYGSFSLFGDKVLYTAERKTPTTEVDLTERKSSTTKGQDGLEKYEYKPILGSTYPNRKYPDVFLLAFNLKSDSSEEEEKEAELYCLCADLALQNLDSRENFFDPLLSQAIFSSDGKKVILTTYPTIQDGRRFGLAACTNRPSIVFCIDVRLEEEVEKGDGKEQENKEKGGKKNCIKSALKWQPKQWYRLSRKGYSGRSPTIVSKDKCVWLECCTGGPHKGCDSLCSANISDAKKIGQIGCELDQQDIPDQQTGWPGLFADSVLSRCCTLSSFNCIVISTVWGSRQTIIALELGKSGTPKEVTPLQLSLPEDKGTQEQAWYYQLLCTNGKDLIVAVRSSPTYPQQLLLGRMIGDEKSIKWKIVHSVDEDWQSESCLKALKQSQSSKIIQIPETELPGKGEQMAEAIIIPPVYDSKNKQKKFPLILIPHGGPHGSSMTFFSPALAALALAGFCVVQPNYHGSLGKGQRFVNSLIGHCGTLDVKDCQKSVEFVLKNSKDLFIGLELNSDQVYVDGGSHGGFLSLHLVGQYPTFYRASICRNPVTAAHIMEYTNDIPDWFCAEFGIDFDYSKPPKCIEAKDFENLQNASPFAHINAIQVPVLLLVGLADLRVNPSQSLLIYHSLQSRIRESSKGNLQVRMLTFEGQGHSLDGIEAELICFEARLRWLDK